MRDPARRHLTHDDVPDHAMSDIGNQKAKRCPARNSAGRRCKYRVGSHPDQGGRPLHKRGSMTWQVPTSSLDEVIDRHEARRGGGLVSGPFKVQFESKGNQHDVSEFIRSINFEPSVTVKGQTDDRVILDEVHALDFDLGSGLTPTSLLADWWRQLAEDEIQRTVPKAVEYGSTDLIDIGRNIARLSGRDVDDAQAAELGVYFYLEGKFARWRSAIMEGREVSDDTLFDIGVYIRMAQRIRHAGSWPGIDLNNPLLECNHLGGHLPTCDQNTYEQQTFGAGHPWESDAVANEQAARDAVRFWASKKNRQEPARSTCNDHGCGECQQ